MNRTIIIGDLQGCHDEALELLAKCHAGPDDRVIFTGDLVDRGPQSGKCVELAMDLEQSQGEAACVMGNHEAKHLFYRKGDLDGVPPKVGSPSHARTREQLTATHYDYLAQLPLYLRLPEYNAAVVHAGVFPGLPLEAQRREHLLHIQMIKPPNQATKWPSKSPEGWLFWTNFYEGSELIVFGHTVFDKPLMTDNLAGIDGGACFGRQLHALILPGREIVSVAGKVDYGVGRRDRTSIPIAMWSVHGDVQTYS